MTNSPFQQLLKTLQYKNHRTSIVLECISNLREEIFFLLSINFALFVVDNGSTFFLIHAALMTIFFILLITLSTISKLHIYNELKKCACQLAEQEDIISRVPDKEDYIKWATMESYLLYETKTKENIPEAKKNLIHVCRLGYLICILSAMLLVVNHLMSK